MGSSDEKEPVPYDQKGARKKSYSTEVTRRRFFLTLDHLWCLSSSKTL